MPSLPGASSTLASAASASVSGEDLICVVAPVATNADSTPRRYGSGDAVYDYHGYSEGVEYAARHVADTGGAVIFAGIPIVTAGSIGREDTSGNTGTSATTLAAGGDGVLAEHDGKLTVIQGGTVGTDSIVLGLSMDGGTKTKKVRLGTSTSYTIPYFNVTLSATVGTLVEGDTIHTWHGSGPRGDSSGWSDVFDELAGQQVVLRSGLVCGDMQTDTEVSALSTLIDTYRTSFDRFVVFRVSLFDREPLATMSSITHRMTTANVTFAEVGATGDTITRASGSWASDGFATGDILTISGSSEGDNNQTTATTITVTDATTITLDTDDLVDAGPESGVTIVGEPSLTFADADDTITRAGGSYGSWLDDGFAIGDSVTVSGTSSNDGTFTVTNVTASVLTVETDDLSDEVIGITDASISAGQTKAEWYAAVVTEFGPIDDDPNVDLSAGRARKYSPFTEWYLRIPAGWDASLREYQHDLHIPCWRKADGPTGATLFDSDGNLTEWDDRADGGGMSAARITSYRTWANGPKGAFLAESYTRANDASLLVQTHNAQVVNRIRTVCQAAVEDVIGRTLVKNADGTATEDSLKEIESFVNKSLADDALADKRGEGPRVSNVKWVAARDDDFSVAEPILTSVLTITILGTVHSIIVTTVVR